MIDTDDVIAMSDYAEIRRIVSQNLGSSLRLDGQVAYVTGSTRGIGRAMAATLAEAGAAVVVNGFQDPRSRRYAAELRERFGTDCIGISADQRDPDAIKAAYATIHKTYGRLDILANNAGIVEDALLGMISSRRSRTRTTRTRWPSSATCSWPPASCGARSRAPSSTARRSWASTATPARWSTQSAKAAVIGATKAAAKELAPLGIRVNAIAPGFIDTDMIKGLTPEWFERRVRSIRMGRVGTPEDVARGRGVPRVRPVALRHRPGPRRGRGHAGLIDLLRRHPGDRPALVAPGSGDASVTYGELIDRVDEAAERLAALAGERALVFLALGSDAGGVVLYLACLRARLPLCLAEPSPSRWPAWSAPIARDCSCCRKPVAAPDGYREGAAPSRVTAPGSGAPRWRRCTPTSRCCSPPRARPETRSWCGSPRATSRPTRRHRRLSGARSRRARDPEPADALLLRTLRAQLASARRAARWC